MELWVVILTISVVILVVFLINSHLENLQKETTIRKLNNRISDLNYACKIFSAIPIKPAIPKESNLEIDKKTMLLINSAIKNTNNNEANNAAMAACIRLHERYGSSR